MINCSVTVRQEDISVTWVTAERGKMKSSHSFVQSRLSQQRVEKLKRQKFWFVEGSLLSLQLRPDIQLFPGYFHLHLIFSSFLFLYNTQCFFWCFSSVVMEKVTAHQQSSSALSCCNSQVPGFNSKPRLTPYRFSLMIVWRLNHLNDKQSAFKLLFSCSLSCCQRMCQKL